jgi:hypothetical protein
MNAKQDLWSSAVFVSTIDSMNQKQTLHTDEEEQIKNTCHPHSNNNNQLTSKAKLQASKQAIKQTKQ